MNVIKAIKKQVNNCEYKPDHIYLSDHCKKCYNHLFKFIDNRTKLVCDNCKTEHHKITIK